MEVYLKKNLVFCLGLSLVLILAACFGRDVSGQPQTEVSDEVKEENILIAYFTWADNTVVEDQVAALSSALAHYELVGDSGEYEEADAIASASLVPPGNAARIAGWIQEEIGGDLFSIQVQEPYPSDYDECMDRASDELGENARPALKETIEDISQYDTVFIGYPNWWGDMPMAMYSFLDEYDLSGKTIVPFVTSGGSGFSGSISEIESMESGATVQEGLALSDSSAMDAQNDVNEWLAGLGYLQ